MPCLRNPKPRCGRNCICLALVLYEAVVVVVVVAQLVLPQLVQFEAVVMVLSRAVVVQHRQPLAVVVALPQLVQFEAMVEVLPRAVVVQHRLPLAVVVVLAQLVVVVADSSFGIVLLCPLRYNAPLPSNKTNKNNMIQDYLISVRAFIMTPQPHTLVS